METLLLQGPFGGSGGQDFRTEAGPDAVISELTLAGQELLDSLRLSITNNLGRTYTLQRFGGDGGEVSGLLLATGRYIKSARIRYGQYVDSVSLFTDHGQEGFWGGTGGSHTLDVRVPEGWEICGFFGRAKQYVDSLGFISRPRPH